jgi:hypothetical protein
VELAIDARERSADQGLVRRAQVVLRRVDPVDPGVERSLHARDCPVDVGRFSGKRPDLDTAEPDARDPHAAIPHRTDVHDG